MLRTMTGLAPPLYISAGRASVDAVAQAVWIDLVSPSEAELAEVKRVTGLRVPSCADIAEIETSSRLVHENGVLTLSTPMLNRNADGVLSSAPLGFVVTRDRLLTVRFSDSVVFDQFAASWRCEDVQAAGLSPFLGLLEAIVDRLADVLERIGAEMDTLSAAAFARGAEQGRSSRRRDMFLQATLSEIGHKGARISQLRDGLLGVGRIVRFVLETASAWLNENARHRLTTLDRDVASLTDYDTQLTAKVQFLLDATLGFINIEQNNTIKVLTVVSIVGIPPTFVASLYGMNFHNMPELGWRYGYEYGLSLIALSIVVPLVVFWRRGWL